MTGMGYLYSHFGLIMGRGALYGYNSSRRVETGSLSDQFGSIKLRGVSLWRGGYNSTSTLDQFGLGCDTDLSKDRFQMVSNRMWTEMEPPCDAWHSISTEEMRQDFPLAPGEGLKFRVFQRNRC